MEKEGPALKGLRVYWGECASKQVFMMQWMGLRIEVSTGELKTHKKAPILAWGFREVVPKEAMTLGGMGVCWSEVGEVCGRN